jgi:hypothetical protein
MKSNIIKIAMYIVIILVYMLVFMSNTYAKFTEDKTKSDISSRVVIGEILLNEKNMETEEFEFDVFDTIFSENESKEMDIVQKYEEKIIAPGVEGQFLLTVENDTNILIKYKVEYEIESSKSNLRIPLQFGKDIDGDNLPDIWTNDLNELAQDYKLLEKHQKENTDKIWWKWSFDEDDILDTALGTEGTAEVIINATIIAEQYLK